MNRKTLWRFDFLLFLPVLALVLIGIIFIHSASYRSAEIYQGYYTDYSKRQVVWLGIAFLAFWAALLPGYNLFSRYAYTIYALGLLGLVTVLIIGREIGGAKRWLAFGPLRMQPSEFMKLAFLLALAKYLIYKDVLNKWWGLAVPLALAAVPMALVLRQPDLGTALLFLPILFVVVYVAGAKLKHLLALVAAGVASLPLFWFFVFEEYMRRRLIYFISPGLDPRGGGYQLIQSKIAVGSGGLLGKGLGQGTQNMLNFLLQRHTDFIFSVIAEEWGTLGVILIFSLFFFIILFGLEIALRTREPFGRLLATGVVTLITTQVVINTGMAVGLVPITGLTLPFVSYGGSSLVTSFIALGLLLNVGLRHFPVVAPEDFQG
ncbi:MAG: hypothetical protein AMS15_02020 [Planctomycetes bacterium DG_23]|nr:MAG: hypothetical protein AMS15_02020 [Planctomycetes bacterium DG_23]